MAGVKTQGGKTQGARREQGSGASRPDVAGMGNFWPKEGANPYVWGNTMNFVFPILCLAAAGFAGYLLEPSLRPTLTGKPAVAAKAAVPAVVAEPPPPSVDPVPAAPAPVPVTPAPAPVVETPAPAPEPMPEPEPAPEPAPVEPPVAAVLGAEEIVKLIQDSIRSKQIKEFGFDDVLTWKAGDEEEVDGVKYQTGIVTYKAATILGVKTIPAKALIQGGKVAKWIWPNTKTEIK